jgi:PadR family transcriptional regulator PadR
MPWDRNTDGIGWDISQRIQQISGERLQVQQGSIYLALHRLERRGWIKGQWDVSANSRRARYYRLTAAGRRQLDAEARGWRLLVTAVNQVLDTAP